MGVFLTLLFSFGRINIGYLRMEPITIDGLKIPEIALDCLILDMGFEVKPNEHGHAYISLRVLNDGVAETEIKSVEDKIISIKSKTAGVLFKGYIEDANIIQTRNDHVLELGLVTTSIKLDKCRRSNSFQKESLTIEDVVTEAVKDDSGICEYIDSKVKSEEIKKPIIRYDESGWEFVKRIASRYWMPVFVDEIADKGTVKIGIKGSGSASSEEFLTKNVSIAMDLSKYIDRKAKEKGSTVKRDDYKYVKVKSYANFNVGTSASYEGVSGIILTKKAYLEEGELVFEYIIGQQELYGLTPQYNQKLHGLCLEGKVEECENEDIKLQLDIDDKAKKTKSIGDLYFFPWQPETGNLMYCMPEKDTVVSLYVGGTDEGDAIVINSLRKDKGKEIDKPENRYLTTAEGKRMFLKKDEMGFSNDSKDKGSNFMAVRDDKEICFDTKKDLFIQADGDIEIVSGSKLAVKCQKSVNIIQGTYSINLKNKFNVYAKDTKTGIGVTLAEELKRIDGISFEGLDAEEAQNAWKIEMQTNVFNRTDLSNEDKVAAMAALYGKMSKEQQKDFNVLANADALKPESEGTAWGPYPPTDWPNRMGLKKGQKAINRKNPIPVKLDRIGALTGNNFGVMPEDGHKYSQDERAIAYIENDNAYHKYEFDNTYYFDYIDIISDDKQTTPDKLNAMIQKNTSADTKLKPITQKEFDKMKGDIKTFVDTQKSDRMRTRSKYGLIGEAEEWYVDGIFIAKGGAGQLNTPVKGEMLQRFGVLKEVT